jgi:methionine-rich copper-binding protein CopC
VTVTHPVRIACAVLIGLILLLVDAIPAAAHAELVSSSPEAGSTVSGTPDEIVVVFDEALEPNSSIELLGPDGASEATGNVDPADRTRMVIEPGDLAPGEYEVRWAAASADGHIERGTFPFTVVEPTPRPTAAPTATPRATPSPTVSPGPTASPTPGNGTAAGGSADVLLPLLAVIVAIAALGAFLLRNRRSAGR